MIKIGNKHRGDTGEYCARPSPLGNPYNISRALSRDRVCDLYEEWLDTQILASNEIVLDELERLYQIHQRTGELTLLCWCAPQRCHCESIKDILEVVIENV
jgi:hypothetical protein